MHDRMRQDAGKLAPGKSRQQAVGDDDRGSVALAEAEGERQFLGDMAETRHRRQSGPPTQRREARFHFRGFGGQQRPSAHRRKQHLRPNAPDHGEAQATGEDAPHDAVPAGDEPAAIGEKPGHRQQQRDYMGLVAPAPANDNGARRIL
jgi:hypothetical protein